MDVDVNSRSERFVVCCFLAGAKIVASASKMKFAKTFRIGAFSRLLQLGIVVKLISRPFNSLESDLKTILCC